MRLTNPLLTIGLVLVALIAGTCAFVYEPPLSESYTGIRVDFPRVHNFGALLLAVAAVLVLGYVLLFARAKKPGAK